MKHEKMTIQAAEGNDRSFQCVMSAEVCDREGEVVLLDGLDLEPYTANPVVMFAHGKDKSAGKIPVGRMKLLERRDGKIIGEGVMASRPDNHPKEEEWLPDTLLSLMQQRCLNAVSIGFIPISARRPTSQDILKYGKDCETVTTKSELIELSLEPTPCNQDALITAVSKGLLPKTSKAWEGEAVAKPKEKTVVDVSMKRVKHTATVRISPVQDIAKRVEVRVKGGLYV